LSLCTILVPVTGSRPGSTALATAFVVGRRFKAHVEALHVRPDTAASVPVVGEGLSGSMVDEMIQTAEQEADSRTQQARQLFDEACRVQGVDEVALPPGPDGVSAGWRQVNGDEETLVAGYARIADLTVVGRPDPDADLSGVLESNAALVQGGGGVLVSPARAPEAVGHRVCIAWNGSVESGRAVRAAMPFLETADQVTLLAAREGGRGAAAPGELAAFLAWHGIDARTRYVEPGHHEGIGEALERVAGEHGCDLFVMGAYTHSRLREFILGGVTRYMLEEADLTLLMSH